MKVYRKGLSCSGGGWSYAQKVKIFCDTNHFPSFQFCVPHKNSHGVRGWIKQYHIVFNTKIGHVTCEILHITCACTQCTSTLDKPWTPGVILHQQPNYQPFKYFTHWPVLGYFNNWNIINFSHTATSSE